MAQEGELYDYISVDELKRPDSNSGATEQPGRRLLRVGIITLGVMCILQATLNVSLRLAFFSKEDTDPFPVGILSPSDFCQMDQNTTELCSCCNDMLRKLIKEYKALLHERDVLQNTVLQVRTDNYSDEFGSAYEGNDIDSGYI